MHPLCKPTDEIVVILAAGFQREVVLRPKDQVVVWYRGSAIVQFLGIPNECASASSHEEIERYGGVLEYGRRDEVFWKLAVPPDSNLVGIRTILHIRDEIV